MLEGFFGDAIGAVVQGKVGTERTSLFAFFVAAVAAGDAGTDRFGHLDDGGTDAAGTTDNEDFFAGLKVAALDKTEVGGDSHESVGGGVFVADAVGSRVEPVFIDDGVFREGALATEESLVGAPNAIADFEASGFRADGFGGAGEIATDDEGRGELDVKKAGPHVGIDGVQ